MDQQKRLLLAIALSFGLTLVWTQLFWKPQADAEAAMAMALARLDAGVVLDAGWGPTRLTEPGTAAAVGPPGQTSVLDRTWRSRSRALHLCPQRLATRWSKKARARWCSPPPRGRGK